MSEDGATGEGAETRSERIASLMGKTAAEVAALDRVFAGLREYAVAKLRLDIAMQECSGKMRDFCEALRVSDERLSFEEAAAIAQHPDLAEVNVYLDSFYSE